MPDRGVSGTGVDPYIDEGVICTLPHAGHHGYSGGGKSTPPMMNLM